MGLPQLSVWHPVRNSHLLISCTSLPSRLQSSLDLSIDTSCQCYLDAEPVLVTTQAPKSQVLCEDLKGSQGQAVDLSVLSKGSFPATPAQPPVIVYQAVAGVPCPYPPTHHPSSLSLLPFSASPHNLPVLLYACLLSTFSSCMQLLTSPASPKALTARAPVAG